jgi:hypothetical protein
VTDNAVDRDALLSEIVTRLREADEHDDPVDRGEDLFHPRAAHAERTRRRACLR